MVIICAWCKKKMGKIEPLHDETVSHGICPPCSTHVLQQGLAEKMRRINGVKGEPT
jgi:DNA-directed RNA polymerase subunit RPC12/RpoP